MVHFIAPFALWWWCESEPVIAGGVWVHVSYPLLGGEESTSLWALFAPELKSLLADAGLILSIALYHFEKCLLLLFFLYLKCDVYVHALYSCI